MLKFSTPTPEPNYNSGTLPTTTDVTQTIPVLTITDVTGPSITDTTHSTIDITHSSTNVTNMNITDAAVVPE